MRLRLPDSLSIRQFRRRLAHVDALPQLSLLALVAGLATGLVMAIFRLALEWPLARLLPGGDGEGFEALPTSLHLALPIGGALLLGAVLHHLQPAARVVGVAHVIERLGRHQGHLPVRNALLQFFAGALALASGQSAGREGPAVHLGAAVSSQLGQRLQLPNNSIRTLVGCGSAAAIAASFNTPLAGVIFALEVVMMEYTIASFIPVVIAAVAAAIVSIAIYGPQPAFSVPAMSWTSLWELPFIVAEGLVIGLAAVAFVRLAGAAGRIQYGPLWARVTLAGVLTGCAATMLPQIMGIGYDTVDLALVGSLSLQTLVAIAAVKLVVTAVGFGLGIPAGVIGPTLVIGAMIGGATGALGAAVWPEFASAPGVYVIIGMAAMMAAVLQAPLAALIAVLELTGNPDVLMPAMLAIVVASLTGSAGFGVKSIFLSVLEARGLTLRNDPVTLALQRAAVASIMERRFVRQPRLVATDAARSALASDPIWIVVDEDSGPTCVLAAADLARHLEDPREDGERHDLTLPRSDTPADPETRQIDLRALPGLRRDVALIDLQATLHEALALLDSTGKEALCVTRAAAPMISRIVGVVARADIEKYYGYRG